MKIPLLFFVKGVRGVCPILGSCSQAFCSFSTKRITRQKDARFHFSRNPFNDPTGSIVAEHDLLRKYRWFLVIFVLLSNKNWSKKNIILFHMEKTVQANSVDDAIDKVKSDCPAGMKTCWKCWKNIKEEALQCKYCRSECIHRNQDEFIASVKK